MTQLINSRNVEDNSQNRTAGTERAKEREELSLKKRRTPCSSNLNVQNKVIKLKDSEIRLLRKILADKRN